MDGSNNKCIPLFFTLFSNTCTNICFLSQLACCHLSKVTLNTLCKNYFSKILHKSCTINSKSSLLEIHNFKYYHRAFKFFKTSKIDSDANFCVRVIYFFSGISLYEMRLRHGLDRCREARDSPKTGPNVC